MVDYTTVIFTAACLIIVIISTGTSAIPFIATISITAATAMAAMERAAPFLPSLIFGVLFTLVGFILMVSYVLQQAFRIFFQGVTFLRRRRRRRGIATENLSNRRLCSIACRDRVQSRPASHPPPPSLGTSFPPVPTSTSAYPITLYRPAEAYPPAEPAER